MITRVKKVLVTSVLCFIIVCMSSGVGLAAGSWINTQNGCKVWADWKSSNTTVTWSGIYDKLGTTTGFGSLQWYESGVLDRWYEGNMQDGKRNGKGIFTWKDGRVYEGDWVNDQLNGKGIVKLTDGTTFEGDFVDGNVTGKGIHKWPSGHVYEGDWVENKRTGKGILKFPDGAVYEGDFVDGKETGKGIYKWPDGSSYKGDFLNDKIIATDAEIATQRDKSLALIKSQANAKKQEMLKESIKILQSAFEQLNLGDYNNVIQLCTQAIQLDSNNAGAYDCRATAYYSLGKYNEAIADTEKAVSLVPTYAAAWNNNGKAYLAKRDYERALRSLQKAVSLAPNVQQFSEDFEATKQQKNAEQQQEEEKIRDKYPVGSKVEVLRWSRIWGPNYGYAGIVRGYSNNEVTLEVCAFLNVNEYVEGAPPSGGVDLYKGSSIGAMVTIHPKYITSSYSGSTQTNYSSQSNSSNNGNPSRDYILVNLKMTQGFIGNWSLENWKLTNWQGDVSSESPGTVNNSSGETHAIHRGYNGIAGKYSWTSTWVSGSGSDKEWKTISGTIVVTGNKNYSIAIYDDGRDAGSCEY